MVYFSRVKRCPTKRQVKIFVSNALINFFHRLNKGRCTNHFHLQNLVNFYRIEISVRFKQMICFYVFRHTIQIELSTTLTLYSSLHFLYWDLACNGQWRTISLGFHKQMFNLSRTVVELKPLTDVMSIGMKHLERFSWLPVFYIESILFPLELRITPITCRDKIIKR